MEHGSTNLPKHMILIKGQPRTTQISSIKRNNTGGYTVCFAKSAKGYNYGPNKISILKEPVWTDSKFNRIFISGILQRDIIEAWKFVHRGQTYWRFLYNNGYVKETAGDIVTTSTSCLNEEAANNVFEYLKEVAHINPLKNEGEDCSILSNIYSKIDFIDNDTAAACFLNPGEHPLHSITHDLLIFPFGTNASQKKSAITAFEHQISVIQGPPGTGKTQTILNIIANIVMRGKTVLLVSNNNSATANVQEKLESYGLSFIVAPLGSRENRQAFIEKQTVIPKVCSNWALTSKEEADTKKKLKLTQEKLDKIYPLQIKKAEMEQERQALTLEWKHFCADSSASETAGTHTHIPSKHLIKVWLKCQLITNRQENKRTSKHISEWIEKLKWWWLKCRCKYMLHINDSPDPHNIDSFIKRLQALYYINRLHELDVNLAHASKELSRLNAKELAHKIQELSMALFKSTLCKHYKKHKRTIYRDSREIIMHAEDFLGQYPVVLSTTFSSRSCLLSDHLYDYVIMDEASQVTIETGALSLTCAHNAVIVGDVMQLPNVVTEDNKARLATIMKRYDIDDGYDCCKNSFLQSILCIIPDVPQTLLREHYRCHPQIINFCNQKFYRGQLVIMTKDAGEESVLQAIKTVQGNHSMHKYNQREIDVIKEEILPTMKGIDDIGIITPYNNQANALRAQLHNVESATVHKFQGREKDAIIMSVVDNQITPFADDMHMINVAVSRAKKKFSLVMTGNAQRGRGNITELLDYIAYNNCTVTESKLSSIFDYLYQQYTEQRIKLLKNKPKISEFASENLTYTLLTDTLTSHQEYASIGILCHIPLREVIRNTSLMSEEERIYASNYNTHLDFLLISRVSKQPILAIETDGYTYHNDSTIQHERDILKNHILAVYGLPLLRLSTKGSNERKRIMDCLDSILTSIPT